MARARRPVVAGVAPPSWVGAVENVTRFVATPMAPVKFTVAPVLVVSVVKPSWVVPPMFTSLIVVPPLFSVSVVAVVSNVPAALARKFRVAPARVTGRAPIRPATLVPVLSKVRVAWLTVSAPVVPRVAPLLTVVTPPLKFAAPFQVLAAAPLRISAPVPE